MALNNLGLGLGVIGVYRVSQQPVPDEPLGESGMADDEPEHI